MVVYSLYWWNNDDKPHNLTLTQAKFKETVIKKYQLVFAGKRKSWQVLYLYILHVYIISLQSLIYTCIISSQIDLIFKNPVLFNDERFLCYLTRCHLAYKLGRPLRPCLLVYGQRRIHLSRPSHSDKTALRDSASVKYPSGLFFLQISIPTSLSLSLSPPSVSFLVSFALSLPL